MADPTSLSEAIAASMADRIRAVEIDLLRLLTIHLKQGIDIDQWSTEKLAQIARFYRETQAVIGPWAVEWAEAIEQAIEDAVNAGMVSAHSDIASIAPSKTLTTTSMQRLLAIAHEETALWVTSMEGVPGRILRDVNDAYRRIVSHDITGALIGTETRLAATQRIVNSLAAEGITSFVDKAGRRWRADTYAEMATRTALGNSAMTAALNEYADYGFQVVQVTDAPRECPKCAPWENQLLALDGITGWREIEDLEGNPTRVYVKGTYHDALEAGFNHPNCFPAGVLVSAPSGVDAADTRWYKGELVVIHTALGNELSVTPNHPILTPEGWVPAGSLQEGQNVLSDRGRFGAESVLGPDDKQVPARIGDVFDALRQSVSVSSMSVPSAPEQFHGDGSINGEVEVIRADRLLKYNAMAGRFEDFPDSSFLAGGVGLRPFFPDRSLSEISVGSGHSPHCVMSGGGQLSSLAGSHAGDSAAHSFASTDSRVAVPLHAGRERGLTDSDGGRSLALSLLAGDVALDSVIEIERSSFAGHVYNLQTGNGWYLANSIVVHNCRHGVHAFLPGYMTVGGAEHSPEMYEAAQQQRYMERQIRKWKREDTVALTPDRQKTTTAKVKQWQASLRTHLKDYPDLPRLRYRETTPTPR